MGTLKISRQNLYKIKVENRDERKESFFKNAYDKAKIELKKIIEQNNDYEKSKEKDKDQEDLNNIIAFVGERGSGKTSTMLSFSKYLKDKNEYENEEIKYNCLRLIDPSVLTKSDSIVEIVIGELFKEFQCNINDMDYILKQELIRKFNLVYKDLKILNQDSKLNPNEDNIENLVNLSSAINAKKNIKELIKCYLNVNNKKNKAYLVINIDDLDMNIATGQAMLEDIRKYLMIPNVIILMAIKIEQLQEVVTQKNVVDLEKYQKLYIESKGLEEKDKFISNIDNKTFRYLEKILPFNRRIELSRLKPDIDKVSFDESFNFFESYSEVTNVKEFIRKIFEDKFNYRITSDEHLKIILPDTIRSYIQLFDFLDKAKNPIDKVDYESYFENIAYFKEYIKSNLINKVDDYKGRLLLDELLECGYIDINKKVVKFINISLFKNDELLKTLKDNEQEGLYYDIKHIERVKPYVINSNVSFGYLITWIRFAEMYMNDNRKLIEMIKMVVSIRYLSIFLETKINFKDEKWNKYGTNIIAKHTGYDLVGRFFELSRNKHINTVNNRIESISTKAKNGGNNTLFNINNNYIDDNSIEKLELKKVEYINEDNTTWISINLAKFKNECDKEIENINELYKEITKKLNLLFILYEPYYQEQLGNRISVLYRYDFSLNDDWTHKYSNTKYSFKPCNIIGYRLLKGNNNTDELMISIFNIDEYIDILYKLNQHVTNRLRVNVPTKAIETILKELKEIGEEKGRDFNLKYEDKDDEFEFLKKNIDKPGIFETMDGYKDYPKIDKKQNKESKNKK